MKKDKPAPATVALIEHRLDLRRVRMARHLQELQVDLKRARKWLPYAGAIVALGIGGFAAARAVGARREPIAEVSVRTTRRPNIAATAIALIGTAVRYAMSAQGRALWRAWRARKDRDFSIRARTH